MRVADFEERLADLRDWQARELFEVYRRLHWDRWATAILRLELDRREIAVPGFTTLDDLNECLRDGWYSADELFDRVRKFTAIERLSTCRFIGPVSDRPREGPVRFQEVASMFDLSRRADYIEHERLLSERDRKVTVEQQALLRDAARERLADLSEAWTALLKARLEPQGVMRFAEHRIRAADSRADERGLSEAEWLQARQWLRDAVADELPRVQLLVDKIDIGTLVQHRLYWTLASVDVACPQPLQDASWPLAVAIAGIMRRLGLEKRGIVGCIRSVGDPAAHVLLDVCRWEPSGPMRELRALQEAAGWIVQRDLAVADLGDRTQSRGWLRRLRGN